MSVYFVQAGTDGPVKIGFSESVAARLKVLQSSHYEELTLLGMRAGSRRDERRLHAQLAPYRIVRDWFRPTPEVLAAVTAETDQVAAPLLLELRERTGKSRAQVAAELGFSERHLQRLEAGEQLPRRWAVAFAGYYGVAPEDLAA